MKTYRFKFDPSLDFLPPEELRVMQTLILREHLQFCSQYSPYYKRLFGNRDWSRFTPDRLPELPLTEKCDIAKDPEDFQASPWRDVMDVVFSSGSHLRLQILLLLPSLYSSFILLPAVHLP